LSFEFSLQEAFITKKIKKNSNSFFRRVGSHGKGKLRDGKEKERGRVDSWEGMRGEKEIVGG